LKGFACKANLIHCSNLILYLQSEGGGHGGGGDAGPASMEPLDSMLESLGIAPVSSNKILMSKTSLNTIRSVKNFIKCYFIVLFLQAS
jgi:hypothetical protein